MLIEGFKFPPTVELTHNPPYYADLIEGCGLAKVKDYVAYMVDFDTVPAQRIERLASAVRKRANIEVRCADMKHMNALIAHVDGYGFHHSQKRYRHIYGPIPSEIMKRAKDMAREFEEGACNMTDEITEYGPLFDKDTTSPEYRLEALALRLSHDIADALAECGISRSELAGKLGVSAPMVTKILSGRSNFTLKTLATLADALDYEFEPVFRPRDRHPTVEHIQAPAPPARAKAVSLPAGVR